MCRGVSLTKGVHHWGACERPRRVGRLEAHVSFKTPTTRHHGSGQTAVHGVILVLYKFAIVPAAAPDVAMPYKPQLTAMVRRGIADPVCRPGCRSACGYAAKGLGSEGL
jgi:hypothetical protein